MRNIDFICVSLAIVEITYMPVGRELPAGLL